MPNSHQNHDVSPQPQSTSALTILQIICECPECGKSMDRTQKLKAHLDNDLRATGINIEMVCGYCNHFFYITEINY